MDLMITFLKNFSILVFIVFVLGVYNSVPEDVAFGIDAIGKMDKSHFFYAMAAFVILINLFLTIFVKYFNAIPIQKFKMPKSDFWLENEESRLAFFYVIQSWAYSLMAVFNALICLLLFKIYKINDLAGISGINLLPYLLLIAVAVLAWVVFILRRFHIQKYSIWE